MLAKIFDAQKALHSYFKTFSSKIEILSNIQTCFVLENNDYIIKINIEENEIYASIILERKKDKKVYYALSDYSFLPNATDIFCILTSINKNEYYQEIRDCLKQKSNKNNSKEISLVMLIYKLLETFILEIA